MRIIAGEFRGRLIKLPAGSQLRPSSERLREGLFSALGSLELLAGAEVLDLYAGSGSLGVEALSRGASRCTFVERERSLVKALAENLEVLGAGQRSTVCSGAVLEQLLRNREAWAAKFSLVLIDPPYFEVEFGALLTALLPVLRSGAVGVIETHAKEVEKLERAIAAIDCLEKFKDKRYGDSSLTFISHVHDSAGAQSDTADE